MGGIVLLWVLSCVHRPQALPAPPETRDTLVIAVPSDINELLPMFSQTYIETQAFEMLSVPVLEADFACGLSFGPGLAESWSHSEDGAALSMTLRRDLRWEDGAPVTAHDIAFAYDVAADPAASSPRASLLDKMKPGQRPHVIDETHLEWRFTEPYDQLTQLSEISLGAAPAHQLARIARAELRGAEQAPLSYGPFRLAARTPGERLVFEPNPAFHGPPEERPRLDRVILRVIPDYSTRLLEIESGTVDLVDSVQIADADRLRREHEELRIVDRGVRSMDYVAWNLSKPMFSDAETRRALALAVDVDGLMKELLGSESGEIYGRRAVGTVTPELCDAHNSEITPLPFDPAEARRLLSEAGWQDTDSDGILDRDGQPFSFSLLVNDGNTRRARTAEAICAALGALGIDARIEALETSTFFGRMQRHDFDAAVAGWSAGLFVDLSALWGCGAPFNFTGYCDPALDALDARAQGASVGAEPLWREAQAKIYEAQPYLFLWWMDDLVAVHRRFEHTTIDLLSPWRRLQRWEVPPEQVKYPK